MTGPYLKERGRRPDAPAAAVLSAALVAVIVLSWAAASAAQFLYRIDPAPGADGRLPADLFTLLALSSFFGFLSVSAVLLALYPGPLPAAVRSRDLPAGLAGLGLVLACSIGGSALGRWVGETYSGAPDLSAGGSWRVAATLSAVVAAPILEELFFRELVQIRILGRLAPWKAIGVSATVFGLFHLASGGPVLVTSLAAMGAVLGWVRVRTGSLGPPIVLHALNNLIALRMLS